MKILFNIGASAILMLSISFPVYAEVYKWTDKNGKVHYSDKKSDQGLKIETINSSESSLQFKIPRNDTSKQNPIIRPYERNARKLHLLDMKYSWKKEEQSGTASEIGGYFTGTGCAFRGKMKVPDVFIQRQGLLPKESDLAYRINKIIKGLDYDSERTKKYDLLRQLEKSGGLSLHSEIVEFQLNACANSRSFDNRKRQIRDISNSNFRRHDIKLKVNWLLKSNRDQQIVYETTTDGYFDNFQSSASASQAVLSAIESATLKLFSNQDFVSKIIIVDDKVDLSELPVSKISPINADSEKAYKMLNLLISERKWNHQLKPTNTAGSLLFGDKCSAKKALLVSDAKNKNIQLLPSANISSTLIRKTIKEFGYSVETTINKRFTSFDGDQLYTLTAGLVSFKFEGCAPSLSSASKYVPIGRIDSRKITRKRAKIAIDWQLIKSSDQSVAFQTTTEGVSGSLLDESLGSKTVEDAIEIATRQLLSNENFIQKITINNNLAKSKSIYGDNAAANRKSFSLKTPIQKGISNSQQGDPQTIFLVTPEKHMKSKNIKDEIGIYAYGEECRAYKGKLWPQDLNENPSSFVNNTAFIAAQAKIINSLAYKYQVTDKYNVLNLQRKIGGLSLSSEIVSLRYDSCAPEINAKQALSGQKISSRKFKHNRAIVAIKWTLIGDDESDVRYQGVTEGLGDSWLRNSKGSKILSLAIESATTQLFAQQEFIDKLVVRKPKEEKGFFSKLFSSSNSNDETVEPSSGKLDTYGSFKIRAYTANVLSEITPLKIMVTEFYMSNGMWPSSLSDLGISDSMFSNSTISHVGIQSDGSILAELKATMGKDKIIKLTPSNSASSIRWQCTSNIAKNMLVSACESF